MNPENYNIFIIYLLLNIITFKQCTSIIQLIISNEMYVQKISLYFYLYS
jgi:hypothetical protein